jgi:hypothetical protein
LLISYNSAGSFEKWFYIFLGCGASGRLFFKKMDLFKDIHGTVSLVHCISSCASQSKGFAKKLVSFFPENKHLPLNKLRVGTCYENIMSNGCTIFNLVTKKNKNDKLAIDSLTNAIRSLVEICSQKNLSELKLPRIASGLDNISWRTVLKILQNEFVNTDVALVIYKY